MKFLSPNNAAYLFCNNRNFVHKSYICPNSLSDLNYYHSCPEDLHLGCYKCVFFYFTCSCSFCATCQKYFKLLLCVGLYVAVKLCSKKIVTDTYFCKCRSESLCCAYYGSMPCINFMSKVRLEKLIVSQKVKKFPAFYGT
jgi:hypothetical protein